MSSLKPGITISHYRILSQLGAGGMGEVYLATDTSLDRNVALKTLSAQDDSDPKRIRRFLKEAKAASALNHPNIAHIYEIANADKIHFISMEYVDGKTISAEIADAPMEEKRIIEIAIQMADAVETAHSKGIIHRDLKPGNVMITASNQVKILDFGLAKLLRAEDESPMTQASTASATDFGLVVGTFPYMSPEQIRAQAVDVRTDLFSFGAVLYEMATGRRAFSGQNPTEIIEKILVSQPDAIARFNYKISPDLDRIIRKCLEKDAKQRYQSAADILIDLRNLQRDLQHTPAVSSQPLIPSIVVLPFEDLSPGKDNEYFSDGLTDEIITDLSQIEQLRVISRTSAMAVKGTAKDIKKIARDLNVSYVVQGTVRKSGNDLRVTAQLVDATTDVNLWAAKHSGTLNEVFDFQEKVSRAIVESLNLRLNPQLSEQLAERPIKDPQAYESYLRALHAIWLLKEDAIAVAERELQKTIQIVGDNELVYGTLGTAYVILIEAGGRVEDYMHKAEDCVTKVFQLNSESPYGYALRGFIHYRRGNIQESVNDLKRAHSSTPNNTDVLRMLSYCYLLAGQPAMAKPLSDRLLELDPLTAINHALPGFLNFTQGKLEMALQNYQKLFELTGSPLLRFFYAWILAANDRKEDALFIFDSLSKDPPTTVTQFSILAGHALRGEKELALAAMTPELMSAGNAVEYIARIVAEFYAITNAKKEAMDWLEKDVQLGFMNYPYLATHSPFFSNLRGEERFMQILDRVKYSWEHFEV